MEQPSTIPKNEQTFLNLTKPIIFFDLETTGTSISSDRIVEICAIKINQDGSREELYHLINPTIPIAPGAVAVHGITDEMVADKPTFGDLAIEMSTFFQGCDLGGYNIKRFDVPLIMEEFHRHKKYPINFNEVKLVDPMGIYHSKEKRDLSAAVKFYCQREHVEAHSAKADVLATIDILKHQLLKYNDLEANTNFLHDYLSSGNNVDLAGKFIRDLNGEIVFNFGKHKDREACTEPDYLLWMFEKGDFAIDTKMVAKKIYMHCKWEEEIKAWLNAGKILQTKEMSSALYSTVNLGHDIFPFTINAQGEKTSITCLNEPASHYTCINQDAIKILLKILKNELGIDENDL